VSEKISCSKFIRTNETMPKLRKGDRNTLRDLYKSLLNDGQLLEKFKTSLTNAGFSNYLTDMQVKDVWKYVLTKTFHAQIGVVTGRFADATTGHYVAGGQTDPFRMNLKCLTRRTTIQRVQRKKNSTDDGTQKIDDNTQLILDS